MKKSKIKYIFELVFIFVLPLLFIVCCFNIQKQYTYDNSGNYETSNYTLVFNSPIELNTHEIVSNHTFIGYEVINEYSADDNISTCIIDMSNNYLEYNYYVNVKDFDIINYYGEMSFRSYNDNEIDLGSNNTLEIWNTNATILYNISGNNNGGDWWDDNIILIDAPSFYTYLNDEANYYNMNINTYYIGEGYFNIYVAKYLDYNSYVETENINLFGKIENLICNTLQISNNIVLDILIVYTFLWFIMFIIWHLFYLTIDFLLHFWKKEDD